MKKLILSFALLTGAISFTKAQSLNFDGVDDYVMINQTPSVRNLGPGSFSMEAWVNPTDANSVYSIFRKSGDYNLYIDNGILSAEIWTGGEGVAASWNYFGGTALIPSNTWTHVAAVWDGSNLMLYINGQADLVSSTNSGNVPGNENLCIGVSLTYGQNFFGSMDELRIWNVARTQAEIQDYMNCSISSVQASLVANYDCNQGLANGVNTTVDTLIDASANVNKGTLINFALNGTVSNWVDNYVGIDPTVTVTEQQLINIATSGTANASDSFAGNPAADAFDGDIITTGWGNNNAIPSWLEYDFGAGNAKVLSGYSFYCSSLMTGGWVGNSYNPSEWTFEGFNGTTWDTLDIQVNNNPVQDVWNDYLIANTTAYEKYRINISNSLDGGYTMITELKLLQFDSTTICGNKVFNASTNLNYLSAAYQWQVNGVNVGTNSSTLLLPSFSQYDTVSCVLTTNKCASTINTASNNYVIQQGPNLIVNTLSLCYGQSVTVGSITHSVTGNFTDTLVNMVGCDSIIKTNLTVANQIDVTTSVDPLTLIITSNQTAATYQWIDCGNANAPIAGETNQNYTATVNGNYAVVVTVGSCSDTSACVNISTVGVKSLANQSAKISVYPNPATDAVYIQTGNVLENAFVEVYDVVGQKVIFEKMQNNLTALNLSKLTTAVYQIRVISNNAIIYQSRIVKQ